MNAQSGGGPLLVAERLSLRRGRSTVVHDVDLEVRPGEVVALLGPNGAGKSTLLECLGGIVKPSRGSLRREGRVASVLQTPGLARRTVRGNVELALTWWGVPRSDRRARAIEALEQMHADHLSRRPSTALSGGERRRVHVARGIALRPDVLLLDEPFAGLDGQTHQSLVEDTASALRTAAGAVVVVVHDRADAWALADRVVVMMDGRVAADGPPVELLDAPPSAEVARFLGYDGRLARGDGVLLTRPADVRIDAQGAWAGRITRIVGTEDGATLEVEGADGVLRCQASRGDPAGGGAWRVGEEVRLTVTGGREYDAAGRPRG